MRVDAEVHRLQRRPRLRRLVAGDDHPPPGRVQRDEARPHVGVRGRRRRSSSRSPSGSSRPPRGRSRHRASMPGRTISKASPCGRSRAAIAPSTPSNVRPRAPRAGRPSATRSASRRPASRPRRRPRQRSGCVTTGTVVSQPCAAAGPGTERTPVAVIDVAGFVADLKSQAIDHGFHVHDERHFVETYSLRQLWEVDLHPEEACSGPIDLHLSLDVDPRAMLGFEDEVMKLEDARRAAAGRVHVPARVHVDAAAAPRSAGPARAGHRAGRASAASSCRSRCRRSTRSRASPTPRNARCRWSPAPASTSSDVYLNNDESVADNLERCKHVSLFLLERAKDWLGDL